MDGLEHEPHPLFCDQCDRPIDHAADALSCPRCAAGDVDADTLERLRRMTW